MKKTLWGLATIAATMLLAACGDKADNCEILGAVPANADYAVTFNPTAFIESAGGSVTDGEITLPAALTDNIGTAASEMTDFFQFIHEAGISTETSALFGYFSNGSAPIIVTSYADYDKLVATLEANEFTPQANPMGSLEVYGSGTALVALTDSYLMFSTGNYAETVIGLMESAANQIADKSTLAGTPMGRALTAEASDLAFAMTYSENMINSFARGMQMPTMLLDMFKGAIVCGTFKLSDNSLTGTVRSLDADGKPIDIMATGLYTSAPANVSDKALSYLGDDQQMVMAFNLKGLDWNTLFNDYLIPNVSRSERVAISLARTYLEKFDGTVALGLGVTDGMTSFRNLDANIDPGKQFSATLVLETAPGQAEGLMTDIRSLLDSTGQPYTSADGGLSVDLSGVTVYAAVKDNMIIVSNNPVSDRHSNDAVKQSHMADYSSAFAIYLPEDSKLMSDLGLHYSVSLYGVSDTKAAEGRLNITIKDGTSRKFLEKAINLAMDIQKAI